MLEAIVQLWNYVGYRDLTAMLRCPRERLQFRLRSQKDPPIAGIQGTDAHIHRHLIVLKNPSPIFLSSVPHLSDLNTTPPQRSLITSPASAPATSR
jgi:hypothetical protein